ncbi:MAG TPA: UDP-N-acetylmuramate--L-alanine ligase [Salinimicrobium sp.]|nr:UDP-N-acetylmuramate--L-alanine ligase [Salinimicrobium sp.]
MRSFDQIENIFFIGIGGIGMSALARYFQFQGKNVAGYDKTPAPLTQKLKAEGMEVVYTDSIAVIPAEFLDLEKTLIVYTPAIPADHEQYLYFKKLNFQILKRAAVLGMITKNHFTMAVAGTHGKTTTTAILGHLLKESGVKVTAFLGGICKNYESNLIVAGDEVMVVEADEFDRSFLNLSPNFAAVTSMDADHLDIYGENQQLQDSFKAFADLVPSEGKVFVKNGLSLQGTSIGIEDDADFSIQKISIENGSYFFSLKTPSETIENLQLNLPGRHNLMNAATALSMAITYGTPISELRKALASFKGVDRRFNYIIKSDDFVLIDDYAHHPAEIHAVHQAVREMHPGKKIAAVFQPHLFSRTRDFADDFAESLTAFDEVLLLDIYPARELPITGINSELILGKIGHHNKQLVTKENLPLAAKKIGAEVLIIMGAGDISEEVEKVKQIFQQ